jgi:GntR family transcriptional regulator
MSIKPTRGQYRQVADMLRLEIEAGVHAPGSALPSEPRLAEQFGLSRPTINKGVAILRAEGLVHVKRGQGTFVRDIPAIPRNATLRFRRAYRESGGGRGAFDAEVRALGLEPHTDLTEVGPVVPPAPIAAILGLEEGIQALVRRRRMYASATPAQLADSYIPWEIAEGTVLTERDTGRGGSFSRLAELGHAVTRMSETLRVRTPDPAEADFLNMEEDQRVYEITRIAWDAGDRSVEVTLHVMPTHLWTLTYDWDVEN